MSGIATAAGITKPVLYDHFASKDTLFETLLRSIRDGLLAKGATIGQSSADGGVKFRSAVDTFFAFVEAEPEAAKILLIVPQGNPVTVKLSRDVQLGATAAISQLLKSYLPTGKGWQEEAAGEFLKEGLHALAKWWLSHPGPSRADIVDIVVKTCWTGLQRAKEKPGMDAGARAGF